MDDDQFSQSDDLYKSSTFENSSFSSQSSQNSLKSHHLNIDIEEEGEEVSETSHDFISQYQPGMNSVCGSLKDFGLDEELDILGCIEDYMGASDDGHEKITSESVKSSIHSESNHSFYQEKSDDEDDDEDEDGDDKQNSKKEDEWVLDGFDDLGNKDTELLQWTSHQNGKKNKNKLKNGGKHHPIYELESAQWFDGVSDKLRPHHIPIPEKQNKLESKIFNPKLDIELNIKTLTFRLFDGLDFVINLDMNPSLVEGNQTSNINNKETEFNKLSTPQIDLLSHANIDYFDQINEVPSSRITMEKNNGNNYNILKNEKKKNMNKKLNSRKTDKVVEVSFSSLQLRYGEGSQLGISESEGGVNDKIHLYLVCDFIISQCLHGKAQNCLYEWKRYHQANEELDEKGNLMRMLTLDIYTQAPDLVTNSSLSESQLSLSRDVFLEVRIRPLRCCATWDLVDFLRNFASPIIASMEQNEMNMNLSNSDINNNLSSKQQVTPSQQLKSNQTHQIKSAMIHPITLKIDFDTRLIDIEAVQKGDLFELLKLFPLRGVELDLRSVELINSSFLSLGTLMANTYVEDLTSSQLMKFVAGAAPLRPISSIGSKSVNLILLPLEQYKLGQDGKILYGLKVGALDLMKTVAIESIRASLKLSSAVTSGLRFLASNNNDHSKNRNQNKRGSRHSTNSLTSHQYNNHNSSNKHNILGTSQPQDVKTGLTLGQESLRNGLSLAAHAIIAVPMEDYHKGNTKEAVKSLVKAIPIAVLSPMIGASEAISYTFLGIRNSMSPDIMHDEKTRYNV